MANEIDTVRVCEPLITPNGTIDPGWYETPISQIGGAYELSNGRIRVMSSGSLQGEVPLTVMVDAPEHYCLQTETFSGVINVNGAALQFNCNTVVGVN